MKLIAIDRGQVFQPFIPDDVRAERDVYPPQLFALLQQRYGFTGHSDVSKARDEGAKFQNGRLESDDGNISISMFDIYNDGIIVNCRTTEEADIVVDDAIEWAIATFGMRRPARPIPRRYVSWLVVDFEAPLSEMVRNFEKMQKLAMASYERTYGQRLDFDLGRIAFMADPAKLPQHTNTQYFFDRRAGAPFEMSRYFCGAPLQTKDHISLLESFESTFN